MKDSVNHCGIIERMDGHRIHVRIDREPSCAGCSAKSVCMGAGKGHVVEVTDYTGSFRANEAVMLEGRNYMGLQAVALAFVIPLSLIVALIVLGACLGWRESASALAGLSSLFPYYIILYFFRGRLRKRFVFTIKKINS